MKIVRNLLVVALALIVAAPLLAGEGKRGQKKAQKAPACPAAQRVEKMTEGMNLSDEQKTKLADIAKEFGPKLVEAMKSADVLTPDQKKAAAEAGKAAKAAGKKGKEAAEDIAAAVKLTDEQKAKQATARKAMQPLEKELKEKVMSVLNDEQKELLKKKAPAKKDKK